MRLFGADNNKKRKKPTGIQATDDYKTVSRTAGAYKHRYTVEEKIALAKKICNLFSTGKFSLGYCCAKYGVTQQLFTRWASPTVRLDDLMLQNKDLPNGAIPAVQDLYFEAKKMFLGNSREALLHTAYRKLSDAIEGEAYKDVTAEYVIDRELYVTDDNGNKVINTNFGKPVLVGFKEKTGKRATNSELIKEVLYNLDPANFKNRKTVDNTGTVTVEHHVNLEKLTVEELKARKLELKRKLMEKNIDIQEVEFQEVK